MAGNGRLRRAEGYKGEKNIVEGEVRPRGGGGMEGCEGWKGLRGMNSKDGIEEDETKEEYIGIE